MFKSLRIAGTALAFTFMPMLMLGCDAPSTSGSASGGATTAHATAAGSHATPAVFAALSFDEAVTKAKQENKLVIVDAMASWCPPCKMMDKQSWPDAKVAGWLNENALAVQVDVDKQSQWAKTHKIEAMPTIIAFRDGREVKRIVGGLGPSDLLNWLNGLPKG